MLEVYPAVKIIEEDIRKVLADERVTKTTTERLESKMASLEN